MSAEFRFFRIIGAGMMLFLISCARSENGFQSVSSTQCVLPEAPVVTPQALAAIRPEPQLRLFQKQGYTRFLVKHRNGQWSTREWRSGPNETHSWPGAEELADIVAIEPDYELSADYLHADPGVKKQWAHGKVQSAAAWDVSLGSYDVIVAVVDSGVQLDHPDLAENLWRNSAELDNARDDDGNGYIDDIYGWDFVAGTGVPTADATGTYHGTHVAGTIGAVGNNGVGGVGHAPRVKILPLKFLDKNGKGSTSNAVKAVHYAIEKKVQVINMSFGGGGYSQAMQEAIQAAESAGILVVVSAGNGGLDGVGDDNGKTPWYPARYAGRNMLAVAATDESDRLTKFSNYSGSYVHVAAPGKNIYSTRSRSLYSTLSGTSMAAPLVSGVAATMYAVAPSLSVVEIRRLLIEYSDRLGSLKSKVVADGRINAARAVLAARLTAQSPPGSDTPHCPVDSSAL